ncbi:MAG: GNAT family N-acetyltransferase [Pseudomonadota bacterium]
MRRATKHDIEKIRRCAEIAYRPYIPRMGRKPAPMVADFEKLIDEGTLSVCDADGVLAGFIVFYLRNDHLHIENVAVDTALQGKGIGKALIGYAESEAVNAGIKTIELYTNEKMTENLAFYPKLGYREIDRRTEDGFKRVYFRKEL